MTEINLEMTEPRTVEEIEEIEEQMDGFPPQVGASKPVTLPTQQQTDILYAYSVMMTVGGEVRILKDDHIATVREPATSDIIMTSRYIHDTLRSNNNGSTPAP